MVLLGAGVAVGCGTDTTSARDPGTLSMGDSGSFDDPAGGCTPGQRVSCPCPGGEEGTQTCRADGAAYGSCECSGGPLESCGDEVCDEDAGESCINCEDDCGACAPCTIAPACEGREVPPIIDEYADFLDDTAYPVPPEKLYAELALHVERGTLGIRLLAAALSAPDPAEAHLVTSLREILDGSPTVHAALSGQLEHAGIDASSMYTAAHPAPSQLDVEAIGARIATDRIAARLDPSHGGAGGVCDDPRLRVRTERLIVHEEDDDFLNDEVYCVITAEASAASELKVTPKTAPLDEGDQMAFSLEDGLVWGNLGLVAPGSGILLTYNCIESDDAATYQGVLDAVAGAAAEVGGEDVPGVDGWVFPAVGAVAGILQAALALDGDDQLFNASHTVPEDRHAELTTGAFWRVRREGTHLNSDWDWELRMEVWGCHDYGTLVP